MTVNQGARPSNAKCDAADVGARRPDRLDDIAREIGDRGGAAVTCRTDVTRISSDSSARPSTSSVASMCW